MRILVLSIEYPPLGGGASPITHEINRHYIMAGHQVDVVTMGFGNLPAHELVDGINVHRIPSRRAQMHMSHPGEHLRFLWGAKKFLTKFLSCEKFDVCHTHFIIPTGLLSMWVKLKFDIPYIITAHGSDVPGFNPDRFQWLHTLTPPLIRGIIRTVDGIAVPSQFLSSLISKVDKHAPRKITLIPNGIDTEIFRPTDKKPIILSTGRLLERKGFHHIIDAIADADIGYEFHIAGDGPMRETLEQKASASKTKIVFHGWMDNRDEQYRKLINGASIFCLMSSHENASNSLLEAMASGCAMITSNTSGCPETVGSAGICLPPGDKHSLNQELRKLINNDEKRLSLMKMARSEAVDRYHWSLISTQYLSLLQTVANK